MLFDHLYQTNSPSNKTLQELSTNSAFGTCEWLVFRFLLSKRRKSHPFFGLDLAWLCLTSKNPHPQRERKNSILTPCIPLCDVLFVANHKILLGCMPCSPAAWQEPRTTQRWSTEENDHHMLHHSRGIAASPSRKGGKHSSMLREKAGTRLNKCPISY